MMNCTTSVRAEGRDMQTTGVNSWDEFVAKIEELKEKHGKNHTFGVDAKNTILYRGQAKASSKLRTTLERYWMREWTTKRYAELVWGLAPRIESFTKKIGIFLLRVKISISHWRSLSAGSHTNFRYIGTASTYATMDFPPRYWTGQLHLMSRPSLPWPNRTRRTAHLCLYMSRNRQAGKAA